MLLFPRKHRICIRDIVNNITIQTWQRVSLSNISIICHSNSTINMKYFCAELLMEHKIGVMSQAHSVIALYRHSRKLKKIISHMYNYINISTIQNIEWQWIREEHGGKKHNKLSLLKGSFTILNTVTSQFHDCCKDEKKNGQQMIEKYLNIYCNENSLRIIFVSYSH